MANKVHFRGTTNGLSACATSMPNKNGSTSRNGRATYSTIPDHLVVRSDEFRATAPEDRCAHCAEQFTERMNARRKLSGKHLYKDAFTKELV